MTKSWAERFAEERTEMITEGSTEIRAIWRFDVESGATVRVMRKRIDPSLHQAVVLDSDSELRIGETRAKRLVLWSHTSPEDVEIECRRGGQLRVWNALSDRAEPADITKFIIEMSVT